MSKDKKDDKNTFKDTLNLPQTAFDMKANLLTKEPAMQARWRQDDLYGRIRRQRLGAPRFVLHDGPPYANGNIHMGHALNKVLKDMVIRLQNMAGRDAMPFIHGWDCHGQPIEQKVVDELGAAASAMTDMDIRRRCQAFAAKWIAVQKEQFQRLGLLGIDDTPYITMDPAYEASVLDVFARLVQQGLVYRQLKPVHWSIENRTALADAELEYHDRQDPSVYVAFELAADSLPRMPELAGLQATNPALVIWTTTPWTLVANLAVAIHPDFEYKIVALQLARGPRTLIVAAERLNAVVAALAKADNAAPAVTEVGSLRGSRLLERGLKYRHPLIDGKICPVVPATYVTLEDGAGLVHTAPGHGLEDYGTALKSGLEIYCPVMGDGRYDDTVPQWMRGMSVWQANPKVVEHLRENGSLLAVQTITHSYPHDWRSKTPTIFRATEQWFIAVDRPVGGADKTLRQMAMDTCRLPAASGGVDFVPGWGRNRIAGMLESRPDWCISRQRSWGLPIPAFYNKQDKPLLTAASVRAVAAVIAAKGSDSWFKLSPRELLAGYDPKHDPAIEHPEQFPIDQLTAGRDIFDVWFESGSSWFAVAVRRGLVRDIPVDLYLEGADQHRGWFQLSLLPALGAEGKAPFRTVVTHGYVVDETGRTKMSKSLGNAMNVVDQLNRRGADVLRLWIASTNYQDDVRCSDTLIAQAEDSYRKIRNTLRFCMGSCFDFDPARDATEPADHSVDRWMRMQLHQLIRDVRQAYDNYEFHRAARLIYEFCTVQASSIYLSAVKDRLYCESPNAMRRRATQTVIHEMLMAMVKLLAPILPHTCEEAWAHIPNRPAAEPDSVHLALLPEADRAVLDVADNLMPVSLDQLSFKPDELQAGPAWLWAKLLELRDAGLRELEKLRNGGVKNPLDAEAIFRVPASNRALADMLDFYLRELEDLLGVGYARIEMVDRLPEGVAVDVQVADTREKYKRCARSWKRRPDVGSEPDYPELSARDAAVMRELKKR